MLEDEPIFNVPGSVLAVLLLLAAIHVGRSFLATETDIWFVYAMAFIPARYTELGADLPGGETARITSFVTYMLIHGNFAHLAFNSLWLLAFGAAVARRIGGLRFLAFSTMSGIAGALTFLALNPGLDAPMVGASGAVAGLMGGVLRFLFSASDRGGLRRLHENPASVPLMSLGEALTDRRVLFATAILAAVNLLAMFGLGGIDAPGGIAWEAHLGGYAAGLLGFGLFDPSRSR